MKSDNVAMDCGEVLYLREEVAKDLPSHPNFTRDDSPLRPAAVPAGKAYLKAESCEESIKQYCVRLSIQSDKDPAGMFSLIDVCR